MSRKKILLIDSLSTFYLELTVPKELEKSVTEKESVSLEGNRKERRMQKSIYRKAKKNG
jgi:hypothetical protein